MLLALLLLSLFVIVLLGFYVFVAAPRDRAHQTFAAFVACLALWTVKDIALWGFGPHEGSAAWWASASLVNALLLQYSLVIFSWVFPEDGRISWRRVGILFAPGLVLVPATFAGWMWDSAGFVDNQFRVQLRPLAYVFGLYIYTLFGDGFFRLYRKYRRYRPNLWGKQVGAILWALVITGTLKTLVNIVLPLAGIYWLLPVSSVFVLCGVVIYAYAITSFQLFSLQSALDQFRLFPVAYKVALSIAAVAVSSFIVLQVPIVWWSFGGSVFGEPWRRYLVFSVISALVPNLVLVALITRIISRPVRRLTEAAVAVAGGAYGTETKLQSNDEVGLLASSFNEMSRKMAADIERLRALNEQLIRAEKLAAAGTLAAGVAHEVNNPLASISSLIQMLQQKPNADAETAEMLRLISAQIARITRVLRDMMDFARARPVTRTELDVRQTIEASLRLASFDKSFQKLQLKTDFAPELPAVSADADQLQQVFLNILLNARDAMPEGGSIWIKTTYQPAPREVVTEIKDTGPGIAAQHLTQVFDPFFTTKTGGGTGLGLAVCYGIVTQHGGRIEIAPHDGRGTTVRVALPLG